MAGMFPILPSDQSGRQEIISLANRPLGQRAPNARHGPPSSTHTHQPAPATPRSPASKETPSRSQASSSNAHSQCPHRSGTPRSSRFPGLPDHDRRFVPALALGQHRRPRARNPQTSPGQQPSASVRATLRTAAHRSAPPQTSAGRDTAGQTHHSPPTSVGPDRHAHPRRRRARSAGGDRDLGDLSGRRCLMRWARMPSVRATCSGT